MDITTTIHKGILFVTVAGEFDMRAADQFRTTVDQSINESGLSDVIVRLEDAPFIDSSGIGVLLGRYKKIEHAGGKLALLKPQAPVKKILELSGMLDIIKTYDDEQEALRCF